MTLQRKITRSIKKNLSFYLTGSLLTAITVMLLIGAFAVSESLYTWADAYYEKTNIEDASFQTQIPITEEEMAQLEKDYDLTLEKQEYLDFAYQDTKLRLFSPTEKMDYYTITEGSDLKEPGDILLTYRYAKANNIAIGDTMVIGQDGTAAKSAGQDSTAAQSAGQVDIVSAEQGDSVSAEGKTFTVCGLIMKSDYAVMLYDLTETAADKSGFGIGIVYPEDFAVLGNGALQYSVRYLDRDKETAFRTEIYEKYDTQEYLEKAANSRISLIYSEADDLAAEFSLYAPIIMIIVVAVIAMVLRRMIKRDGKTIGTLMALGYRKGELVRHYMVYGMVPAIAGDIIGVIGSIPFAKLFCAFYFQDLEYTEYQVVMPWKLVGVAVLFPIVVYGLVSYLVLNKALQADAVSLLHGLQKEKNVHVFRNSQANLKLVYNVRAVFMNASRSITLIIGIAVATLCIVLGGSFQDAWNNLLENKVPLAMLGGQYEYGFKNYQTENPYGGDAIFDVSFGASADDSRFNLIGYDEENDIFHETVDGKAPVYGEYYMTSSAARTYGIKPGDEFAFYNTVTMQETKVVISGIVENDVLQLVLTSKQNMADILGRPDTEYNVIISKEKLDIPADLLRKNASLKDYENQVKRLSSVSGIVLQILKVLGVIICLLMINMMSGMIVEEGKRNISMLEVLGYRSKEVRQFVMTSNHLLVPIGFVVGVPLGYLTAYSMMAASARSSGMYMGLPVKPLTILVSAAIVAVAYVLSLCLSGRKLKKVDMVESLKCPLE